MYWFLLFFIVSGFSCLVYQIVWLRVATANFGVTTPLISIVLSVIMAGLALGSWGAGEFVSRRKTRTAGSFIRYYAITEAIIAASSLIAAPLLRFGREILTAVNAAEWGSVSYYLASGTIITAVLLPFSFFMGATLPLGMASIRAASPDKSVNSFSLLYAGNVLGALAGCCGSAFVLIELLGFHGTLLTAGCFNIIIAIAALLLSTRYASSGGSSLPLSSLSLSNTREPLMPAILFLIFLTGLISLAMEVVWVRLFVPLSGPLVYTFALILATYLAATFIGSIIYRAWFRASKSRGYDWRFPVLLAGAAGLLPLIASDYRLAVNDAWFGAIRILFGIAPFCALLGFITPSLIDRVSRGDPKKAGFAYALNAFGCILGPLLAGFLLLPFFGERWSLSFLAAPLFITAVLLKREPERAPAGIKRKVLLRASATALALFAVSVIALSKEYGEQFSKKIVKHDHAATVIAAGEGVFVQLLVNGYEMTTLTPITKMMSHLPLAFLERPPQRGLVLCLGMGTSYRSMLSWGISSTVVELVPSIPPLLPLFHPDGDKILAASQGKIVIDDARRFLERSVETYDVIIVDAPPPVEAAASSLLYSVEFYNAAVRRLAPDGILQQWLPQDAEAVVKSAAVKALLDNFRHVRAFTSVQNWGIHLLASMKPISAETASELTARMPAAAAADLVEWGPYMTPQSQFQKVLEQEIPISEIINLAPDAPALSDDRPLNEYYLLRRYSLL
jgi:predicted membrane-bound spermidine synthase